MVAQADITASFLLERLCLSPPSVSDRHLPFNDHHHIRNLQSYGFGGTSHANRILMPMMLFIH